MRAYYPTLTEAIAAVIENEGILIDEDGDVIDANGDVRNRSFSMDIRRSKDGSLSYACAFDLSEEMTMFDGADVAAIIRGEYDPEQDFDPEWISGVDEETVEALAGTTDQEPLWTSWAVSGSTISVYPDCMINERNHCDNGGWEREVSSRHLNEGISHGVANALAFMAVADSFDAASFAHELFDSSVLPEAATFADLVNLVVSSSSDTLENIADDLGCSVSGLSKWKSGDREPKGRALKDAVEDLVLMYRDNLALKVNTQRELADADRAMRP